MTTMPPEPPREPAVLPDQRLVPILRDVGAVVLLVVGVGGFLYAGFATSFEAGVAVLSVLSVAAALVLGFRDEPGRRRR